MRSSTPKTAAFVVACGRNTIIARSAILATGAEDAQPPISDLHGAIRRGIVRHCPTATKATAVTTPTPGKLMSRRTTAWRPAIVGQDLLDQASANLEQRGHEPAQAQVGREQLAQPDLEPAAGRAEDQPGGLEQTAERRYRLGPWRALGVAPNRLARRKEQRWRFGSP